jgi:hypothetical protein
MERDEKKVMYIKQGCDIREKRIAGMLFFLLEYKAPYPSLRLVTENQLFHITSQTRH